MDEIGAIDVNGLLSQPGDLLGVFYENNGFYYGAGYTALSSGNVQFAAWGDDATTEEQDGFIENQPLVWALQYAETGNSVYLEAIYAPNSPDSYTANGLSTIIGFELMDYTNIAGCTNPNYVEFNPFAEIENNSCLTLNVYGCTDDSFLEYWTYNSELLSISLPDVIANTNDGSCLTGILEGCTDSDYTEFCLECNISDNSLCNELVILGCMDPQAINYDELANTDDNTCEFDVCVELELANFEITTSVEFNIPVLSYDIINSSNELITSPVFNLNLSTIDDVNVNEVSISSSQINPGATIHIESPIISDLSTIPESIAISGFVNFQGESFESDIINCDYYFTEVYLLTDHIGCSSVDSYNFDTLATVDDGSCIPLIETSIVVFDPNCNDELGEMFMVVTGGNPPYTSPTVYTQYSSLGVPEEVNVLIDENNTIIMTGLADGVYSVEVLDSEEDGVIHTEFYEFTVTAPEEALIEANITNSFLLTSVVIQGTPVFYQWLLEGETIEGANSSIHYGEEVGNYQVYIEDENGCGSYSNTVYLNTVDLNELSEFRFNMYPNPVNSILTISMAKLSAIASVTITDVLGQEIHNLEIDTRFRSNEITFDASDLESGIYFILVESDSKQIVKRFIKN